MHDGVDAVEKVGRKLANVAEMLPVEQVFGQDLRAAVRLWRKKSAVEADQLAPRDAVRRRMPRQDGADIAHDCR